MKPYISTLTIEKKITGAYGKSSKYAIIDGNGEQLILLDRLFDATICLRFMMGKSMSRNECDIAENLLRDNDERKADHEQNTRQANADNA